MCGDSATIEIASKDVGAVYGRAYFVDFREERAVIDRAYICSIGAFGHFLCKTLL